MVSFLLGPAGGISLALRRAPKLLRVVRSASGEWDALDQLDDEPRPREEIFVYQLDETIPVERFHVCRSPRSSSGWYVRAQYLYLLNQPLDSDVRTTVAWRAWALAFGDAKQ